jgi:hypothetical protein
LGADQQLPDGLACHVIIRVDLEILEVSSIGPFQMVVFHQHALEMVFHNEGFLLKWYPSVAPFSCWLLCPSPEVLDEANAQSGYSARSE